MCSKFKLESGNINIYTKLARIKKVPKMVVEMKIYVLEIGGLNGKWNFLVHRFKFLEKEF